MGRSLKPTGDITKPDPRKKLKVRGEPYWRLVESGLHLGYRKASKGGTWAARRYTEDKEYKETRLGAADDRPNEANGKTILSFDQAQEAARAWAKEERRKELGEEVADGPYTVADAMTDYLTIYKAEGKKGLSVTTTIVNAHINPALGTVLVERLTTKKIKNWLHKLAASPARLRTAKASEQKTRELGEDDDSIRRRKATANRILTVLKAALNYAWSEEKTSSDMAWRKVKPFKSVDAPKIRYLTEDECRRLINTCPTDLREIVQGALFTGCRYGELSKLRVSDFTPDSGTIYIHAPKSGVSRHAVLTDEGKEFFKNIVLGKESNALIFTHTDGTAWGKSHQHRPLKEACSRVKIKPAISFHVLRHTHGSILAKKGVPMLVIAKQLGHEDTRMTERHYAHLSPNFVADTIRQNFPTLGVVEESNVKEMGRN